MKHYYAVHKGFEPGIYKRWSDAEKQVKGFSGAVYKRFSSVSEAKKFLETGGISPKIIRPSKTQYFDSVETHEPPRTKISTRKPSKYYDVLSGPKITQKPNPSRFILPIPKAPKLDSIKTPEDIAELAQKFELGPSGSRPPLKSEIVGENDFDFGFTDLPRAKSTFKPKKDPVSTAKILTEIYQELQEDHKTLFIYTDGSTPGNGKANAKCGYGVYFSDPRFLPISRPIRSGKRTNNVAELQAIIDALKAAIDIVSSKEKILFTDSEWAYLGLTSRFDKHKKNGWMTYNRGKKKPVSNKDMLIEAHALLVKSGVTIRHIKSLGLKAHSINMDELDKLTVKDIHMIGNEIADQLSRNY